MEIKPQNGHTYMTGIIRSLQDENKKLKEQVERMEMMYENTGAIFNRQHMQGKIVRYEKEIEQLKDSANEVINSKDIIIRRQQKEIAEWTKSAKEGMN
jgi:polyhydroxyalkanoate synthesis regulator phasin